MPLSHREAAFVMSLGAGMATGVGASLVLFTTSLNKTLLACTMAFSSGVMLYVSLVEVVAVSNEYFTKSYDSALAYAYATATFFAGALVMAGVDRIVHATFDRISRGASSDAAASKVPRTVEAAGLCPAKTGRETADIELSSVDSDHEAGSILAVSQIEEKRRLLMMAAVVSAAIVLHNIPEGMATYVASFHSFSAGLPLAAAIAIHNIPEGLAIAMPVYYATSSHAKAVALGTLSGFSEPFGAVLASLVANENSSPASFGGMFGLTAGMMSYVCIAELLPSAFAEKEASRETITFAFFFGCLVMATSLVVEKAATAG